MIEPTPLVSMDLRAYARPTLTNGFPHSVQPMHWETCC